MLIGQDGARDAFVAAMESGTIHHAWLLAGPPGVGKGTFARLAARRLLVEGMSPGTLPPGLDVPDDHYGAQLLAAGTHPDYRELVRLPKSDKDAELQRSIKVDQVRTLLPFLGTAPSLSPRRVIVIDAADDLERPGAGNALLKSLEEPPTGTVFFLVSHAPGRLMPTIRSRCRLLRFDGLSDRDSATVLRRALPDADADEVDALVRAGAGSPGRAMGYAGLDLARIDAALAAIANDGDADNRRRLSLAKSLAGKTAQPRYEAFLDRVPTTIAAAAALRRGEPLRVALDAYDRARMVAASARALSFDQQATVMELAGIVARLAAAR